MDEYARVSKWPDVTSINRVISSSGNYAEGIVRNGLSDTWNM